MSIYEPLKKYLASSNQNFVKLSFSDIEKLLNRSLPQSAYTYNAWWANGGHSQANAWMDASYAVSHLDLKAQVVGFSKSDRIVQKNTTTERDTAKAREKNIKPFVAVSSASNTMNVCGYTFSYLQDLIPDCDKDGNVIKYYPQDEYDNKAGLPLLYYGKGAFCRFSITADNWPGVYLWVVDGQIIYIGETAGLKQRFNSGYGNILPRNCYVGGQSTNCKMNKVVLGHFERGKTVSLYFYQTTDYKRVELELLNRIYTPYNVKDN